MTSSPIRAFVLAAAAACAFGAGSAAADPFQVVLMDGRVVGAASRPLIAMGKVSFLDALRTPKEYPTSLVDLEATRARLHRSKTTARVWTEESIAALGDDGVQYVGEDLAAPVEAAHSGAEGEADDAAQGASVDMAALSQADLIRQRIGQIDQQVRGLSAKDRRRTLLILRQLELEQELHRLTTVPQGRS